MKQHILKFKKHFKTNFLKVYSQEKSSKLSGPKFSVCFLDLATYLGIEVGADVARIAPIKRSNRKSVEDGKSRGFGRKTMRSNSVLQ